MTDLRLVAPALAAWAASAATLLALGAISEPDSRHQWAVRLMQFSIVAVLVVIVLFRRRSAIVVTAAAIAVATIAAAMQVSAWTSSAFTELMGENVTVTGVISGPPRESLGVSYVPISADRIQGQSSAAVRIHVPISVTIPRFTDVPMIGTPVRVDGRLRPAGGSVHTAAYLQTNDAPVVTGNAGVIDRAAQRVRDALGASLPQRPAGGSALVAGLAIGDENAMSPELVEQMRMSGLSHLTAVSGGNVAIVIGAVIALAWILRAPMAVRIAAALVALVFYVIVVHPEPSVLRAGVMGAVVVLSLFVGGRRPGPSVLATAVLILVVVMPSLSVSWGFALSVAATAGIVMLAPVFKRRVEETSWGARIPAVVIIAASLTLAAQLATAPVLLAMGAYVGIAAVPANLLAMPVVPLITVAGLAAAIIGLIPILTPIAQIVAWVGAMAGEWIAQVASHAATIDLLRIRGSPTIAAIAVVVTAVGIVLWRSGSPVIRVATASTITIALIVWTVAPPDRRAWPPSNWALVQCDVGQGDGLVIAPHEGTGAVVVDTGISARVIDRCLSDLGIDHIAALVLTHFHADHVNGLAGVVDGRRVDAVFTTIAQEPEDQAAGVHYELNRRGLTARELTAGMAFTVGAGEYRVIWPRRIITSGRISEGSLANNASIVIDARVHGLRLLLTGDIEPPAQAAILGGPGDFHVAKIPHHGSPHQHPRFAVWADADIAVVSVGTDNSFGHPNAETLAEWQTTGANVLRTDLHGDIAIVRTKEDQLGWVTRRSP
ncbi:MAG: ComEC/Rec2 family competence protein [Actinomycetota bacterium]|nr:ComEC/Rec2 family competence protein [Actinomycetota bacterium]